MESVFNRLKMWATPLRIVLMQEDKPLERNFFYVSNEQGDVFQVVVEYEEDLEIRIDAHLIESENDEEAHFVWEVPLKYFSYTLDLVMFNINNWFDRTRRPHRLD